MTARDTIAAIATAHGRAGVGIIRLSGPQAPEIVRRLCAKRTLPGRQARLRRFVDADGQTIDSGLVLWFPAPRSYTGEDVVELHGHGNPVLLDLLLRRLYVLGARPARPGEFTERAYLEGRLDLVQAEAVADLISAGSEAAVRAAQRSLQGDFSIRVQSLRQTLETARVHIEGAIDFPEEEIDFLSDPALAQRMQTLCDQHDALIADTERGLRLRDGCLIAIVGRPNAGKSSLLNALAGDERAIVSVVPGTTRDVLREEIRIGQVGLCLVDTAGLRDTVDPVEAEGVRRAQMELSRADHILLVVDIAAADDLDALLEHCPVATGRTVVFNKIDLTGETPVRVQGSISPSGDGVGDPTTIRLSLRTGAGLDLLREHLRELALAGGDNEGAFSARRRHVEALRRVGGHLAEARSQLRHAQAGDLAAEELRLAQQALAELTGEYRPDDLLGAIFSSFCIGK